MNSLVLSMLCGPCTDFFITESCHEFVSRSFGSSWSRPSRFPRLTSCVSKPLSPPLLKDPDHQTDFCSVTSSRCPSPVDKDIPE